MTSILSIIALIVSLFTGPTPAVTTVSQVDLARYQGRWLQLAAIPAPFQKVCARDTSATYRQLPDGLVKVVNRCLRADGSLVRIEGRARVVDAASHAKLQVTFAQVGGQWIFVPGGDYWILGLARDYSWAVVGNPDRTSGFVLSRTATLSATQVFEIIVSLVRSGYNPCAFSITATTGGINVNRNLCAS
jgi:apolipoprotein D and lipocalin family protein